MSYYRNLLPGQYQVGDIIMGRGTNIIIEDFDVNPSDINAQDYQIPRTDEIRFGQDDLKPTTIEIKGQVLYNWLLEDYEGTIPNFWHGKPTAADLEMLWRADSFRRNWGELGYIYYCDNDGNGKIIFGRPGQFKRTKRTKYNPVVEFTAEFRRADTLNYSAEEYAIQMTSNALPQYLTRLQGNTDSWIKILGQGPITNPKITIGELEIELEGSWGANEVFEISSYPWQRRAVDSNKVNLSTKLVGDVNYLDKIKIPVNTPIPVRWTSTEIGMWVPSLGNESWMLDIQKLESWTIADYFDILYGTPKVRLDILNPSWFSKYLAAGIFGNTAACLYKLKSFNTSKQYSEATLVEPFNGRSAIIIMSNDTMTNYAMVEVTSQPGNNWLRIRYGSSPTNYTSILASWQNTSGWGWLETDKIGIGAEPIPGNPTRTRYTAYLNGVAKCYWDDTAQAVSQANRRQGYIFDMDNNLFTQGTGFKDMVCYDTATSPADTGKINLYWRDAWGSVE
mgnify:CR=1 FL=1